MHGDPNLAIRNTQRNRRSLPAQPPCVNVQRSTSTSRHKSQKSQNSKLYNSVKERRVKSQVARAKSKTKIARVKSAKMPAQHTGTRAPSHSPQGCHRGHSAGCRREAQSCSSPGVPTVAPGEGGERDALGDTCPVATA